MKIATHKVALVLVTILGCALSCAQPADNRINGELISPDFPYESHFVELQGSRMHYVDEGEGEVVLFIHGNPTSSYLWRNVIPHVALSYRAIAIDLIGMGKSDKPDIGYTYLEHREYVNAFIDALDLRNITFVIHDWGSVLGFDYAMNNESNVAGIAFMEALVPPSFPSPAEPSSQSIFGQFRTEGAGEALIIEQNYFVEQMIPNATIRDMSEEEMNVYRAPYLEPASRLPTLQWPRELPMGGKPEANVEIITAIGEWMKQAEIPMLYFYGTNPRNADYYVANLKNIETHFLGQTRHYVQEDYPESIGRAVHDWRRRLEY